MIYGRIFLSGISLKTKDQKKLLELACGTGIQSVRFSQAGFDVTGLDLSADMLKIAEKRAASAKQKIDFIEGNMLDLSQAGTYDFRDLLLGFYLLYAGRGRSRGCLQRSLQCP